MAYLVTHHPCAVEPLLLSACLLVVAVALQVESISGKYVIQHTRVCIRSTHRVITRSAEPPQSPPPLIDTCPPTHPPTTRHVHGSTIHVCQRVDEGLSDWIRFVNDWMRSVNDWMRSVNDWMRSVDDWMRSVDDWIHG